MLLIMKHKITIPDELYKSLAKIAYERGFDTEYFIIQLLEHDLEVWERQLSFIKEGENNERTKDYQQSKETMGRHSG